MPKTPSYRSRKGTTQALVTLTDSVTKKRRDYWLGEHGTPESREAYHRIIAQWEANGRRWPTTEPSGTRTGLSAGPTITELVRDYWRWAESYYRPKHTQAVICALRLLRQYFGQTPAADFGPRKLRFLREQMIRGDETADPPRRPWARKFINAQIQRIRHMFKWAVAHEMVPASVHQALCTLEALKRGRTAARESKKVGPVALKLAWQEGVAVLNRTWLNVKRFMLTQAQQMWTGLLSGAEFVWHGLKVGWIEATAFISRTWTRFTSFMELTWATIKNVATKTLNHIKGLFDESFDVDAANLAADQALVAAEQRLEEEKNAQLDQLQRERQDKREAEQQRHESRLRGIVEAEDQALAELDQATDSQLENTRQQLEDARRQLADALAEARRKRDEIEAQEKIPEGGPRGLLDGLADRLEGLGDVIADKITVTGTFNPVAVQGLAAGNDAAQRTATASEQTAKHTKRLADAAVTGGLTFA